LSLRGKLGSVMIDNITAHLRLIRTPRGLTPKFGSFNDEKFDELLFENHLASDARLAHSECPYWIRKLQARFFAGDYASALDASVKAQQLLWTSPSIVEAAEGHFYGAMSQAACCDSALPDRRRQHFEALTAHHKQLEVWAENCPENFENRAALVGAEIARIQGRELEAERLYERAIRSARANSFVHNEALANELAARFYMARGFEKIAQVYLKDARYCYLVGKLLVRCGNSRRPIRTAGRKSQRSVRRARSGHRWSIWISPPLSKFHKRCRARSSWRG
jgi:hypothetical protein